MEAIYRDRLFANDTNTEAASQYAMANVRIAYPHRFGGWKFNEVRVDNVTDTKYIGSVIVNESNNRFYGPLLAGPIWWASMRVTPSDRVKRGRWESWRPASGLHIK